MGLADFLCRARLNRPHLLLPESEVLDTKLAKWSLTFIGRRDLEAQYQEYRGSIHFRRLAKALIWLIIFCFIAISFAFTGLAEETCASSIMGITMGFFVAFIVITFGVLLATDKWPHKLDPMAPVVAIICILMVLNMVYLRLDVECQSSRFANLFGNRVEDALIYFTFTTMSIMYFIHCMFSIRYIHSLCMVGMFVVLFFAWPCLGGSSFYNNISQMRRVEWPRAVQHMAYSCVGCLFLALNRERSERKHFLLKTAFAQGYNGAPGSGGADGSVAGQQRVYWSMEPLSAKKDESRRRASKNNKDGLRKFSLPGEDSLLDLDADTPPRREPETSSVALETPLEAAIRIVDGLLSGSCHSTQRTLQQLRDLLDSDNLNMPLSLERLRSHGMPTKPGQDAAFASSAVGRINRQTSVPTSSSSQSEGLPSREGRRSEGAAPEGGPWGVFVDTNWGSPGYGNSPAMITPGDRPERKSSWDGTAAWDTFLDPEGLTWLADALSKPCVDEMEDHLDDAGGRHLKASSICNLMGVVMNEAAVEPLVLGQEELRLTDGKGDGLVFDSVDAPSPMADGAVSPAVASSPAPMEEAVLGSVSGESNSNSTARWLLPPLLNSLDGGRLAAANQLLGTTLGRWEFNAHELQALTGGKALACVVYEVIRVERLVQKLGLDMQRLQGFLFALNAGFNDRNAYHNGTHAAEVVNAFYCLLCWGGVRELLDDVDVLAGLLASAMLEFRHPGRTNDSLVRTRHKLAVLYNDQSVTQNHAVASAWQLMLDDPAGCDCVAGFPPHQATRVRSLVLDLVLATDLATQHFEVLRRFKRRFLCGDCRQGCSGKGRRHACHLSSPAVLEAVRRQKENPLKGQGGKAPRPPKGQFSESSEIVGGDSPRGDGAAGPAVETEGQPHRIRLCFKDRRLLLMMALKCADVGHLAKIGPLHRKWAERQHAELKAQGALEHGMGLKPSPFSEPSSQQPPLQDSASLYNHLEEDYQLPRQQPPHQQAGTQPATYSLSKSDPAGPIRPSPTTKPQPSPLPHPPPGSPTPQPHWRTLGPIPPATQLPPLALESFPPSVKVSTNPMYHHTRTLSDSDSMVGSIVASPYASIASPGDAGPLPSVDVVSGSGNESLGSLPLSLNMLSVGSAPSVAETASVAAGAGGSVAPPPPSPPPPPLSTSLARFQMSFFAFVGLPLFKAWSAAFESHDSPSNREVMDNLMDNYNTWFKLVEVAAGHEVATTGAAHNNKSRSMSHDGHYGIRACKAHGSASGSGGLIDQPVAHVMGHAHVAAGPSQRTSFQSASHTEVKDLLEAVPGVASEGAHRAGAMRDVANGAYDALFLVPGATMSDAEGESSALSSPTYTPRGAAYQRSLSSVKIMMSLSRPGTPRQLVPPPPQLSTHTQPPPSLSSLSPAQPLSSAPQHPTSRSEGGRRVPAVPLAIDTAALPGPKGSIVPVPEITNNALYAHGMSNGAHPPSMASHLRVRTAGGSADLGSPTGYFDGKGAAPGWVPARGPYAAVEGDDPLVADDSNRNEEDSPLAAFSERSMSSWVDALPGSGNGRHRKPSTSGASGAGGSAAALSSEAKPGGRNGGGNGALSMLRNRLSKLPSGDKRKGHGIVSAPSEHSLVEDATGERPPNSCSALDEMENGDLGRMA